MKLFIVACLIAVSAAGRLEHLENGYLPPHAHQSQGSFGSSIGSSGFESSSDFGSSGFESGVVAARSQPSFHSGSNFNAATSNQYLAPNYASAGTSQFGVASQATQRYSAPQTYSAPAQRVQVPSTNYGAPSYSSHSSFGQSNFGSSSGSSFGSQGFGKSGQYQALSHNQAVSQFPSASRQYLAPNVYSAQQAVAQFPSASRQYLAPKVQSSHSSFQNIPQQAFDEQTGYHY